MEKFFLNTLMPLKSAAGPRHAPFMKVVQFKEKLFGGNYLRVLYFIQHNTIQRHHKLQPQTGTQLINDTSYILFDLMQHSFLSYFHQRAGKQRQSKQPHRAVRAHALQLSAEMNTPAL